MIERVEYVTLNVEFCAGYAGVMMGIKWALSDGLTYMCMYKKKKSINTCKPKASGLQVYTEYTSMYGVCFNIVHTGIYVHEH